MKQVTFAVTQAPFGVGDTCLVPDDIADDLLRDGIISSAEAWPCTASETPAATLPRPVRPMLKPIRPNGRPRDPRQVR